MLFVICFNNICAASVLILVGPPGSGKGHISQALRDGYGFNHISAGDLLRRAVDEKVCGYEDIELKIKAGIPVENKVMHNLLKTQIERCINNGSRIIIDGFGGQSKEDVPFLYELLRINNLVVSAKTLYLVSSDDRCMERMGNRVICSVCARVYGRQMLQREGCSVCGGKLSVRSGDDPNTAKRRLERYNQVMKDNYGLYKQYISYAEFNVDDDYSIDDIATIFNIKDYNAK